VAYDLSQVPPAQRGPVVVAWFNDPMTYPYDHKLVGDVGYNNLGSYTIEANPAAGGGRPPAAGWVTLAAVSGNTKRSRQHLVDLTGYNWLRINVSVSDGSPQNADAAFKLDIHDAAQGARDDWLFLGDSITANTMHHGMAGGGSVGNLSQLISAAQPSFYPLVEDGGIGGVTSAAGAAHIGEWLGLFGGRYVVLSYGTNNAGGGCDAGNLAAFERDYVTMITAVIAAAKVPVIPTIPWANTASIRSCGPRYNALIKTLYARYPQIVAGPDLWAFFQSNPGLISSDNLHPSDAGNGAYRKLWADALLKAVYP
jgi:lysophospholipase L1-like esterase